jgi:ribonucleoside-diphosphate reductase alpha subunit
MLSPTSTKNSVFDSTDEMYVTKRNGNIEIVSFDKILKRIKNIGQEINMKMNYTSLAMKVIDQLYDKISTTKIDELSAEQCASMSSIHPDYNGLAGRIIVSNHHKNTDSSFTTVMHQLYHFMDKHGRQSPLVSDELYTVSQKYAEQFDALCNYSRDYLIDYFGFKTLERAYLMKINGKIVERPQHMWLRVSIGIHGDNYEKIEETYHLMSQKYFTHATPTLFNAGTPHPQLSSCYLISMEKDSIEGIYNTLKDCALISKWAGGIGMHIHNVRASGSHIRGTNGTSNGIVPMLRVFNNTARYVDQCLNPNTIIYTKEGPKCIQNVSNETHIYNKTGSTEMIQNVLEHSYNGPLLEISSTHSIIPLKITPEHPVYVLRNQQNEAYASSTVPKIPNPFVWIDAKDLQTSDYLVYPIPKINEDVPQITEMDCYMYGILLEHGAFQNSQYTIVLPVYNDNVRHFVTDYLNQYMVQYKTIIHNDITHIQWSREIQLPFRYSDFYDESNAKKIHHKWLNLPIQKSKHILKGLLNKYLNSNAESDLLLENTSLIFIESVRFLCMKMGILTSGYVKDTTIYVLRIPKMNDICDLLQIPCDNSPFFTFYRNGDYLLSKITSINETMYTGVLYDLQMTTEHNYLIHNGVVHNGGGRRNGSFAIYLEPWHADFELFLQMRKNHGDEELKARDLFYAVWMPDLFMERVKAGESWTMMCPDECPGLADVYGDEFVELYQRYEKEGRGRKQINARDLWFQILDAQMETGTPYLLYKDSINKKSNQMNVGTIKSSNLCCEITEYSDDKETAVCNLASIALPTFIDRTLTPPTFDFDKLHEITKVVTYNLNRIIDVNYYPTEKTERSNKRHRPIGIGVQGLADVFMMMNYTFSCEQAKELNRRIFETIYHGALEQSCEIAIKEGAYSTFQGSPASKGILQFDMWGVKPRNDRYDWDALKARIMEHGLRNSLLVAPMPTASTSQILGYNECIEPITSNIYSRRTLAGEFIIANKYLMNELIQLDLWNEKIKNNIIANNGSVQQIEVIPLEIREKYKTVWEMPMRNLIDMAVDRGAYICQSQSLNLWIEDPNYNMLTSMHFYGWSKGLKTGIYYLRRRGRHKAQQFTIEPEKKTNENQEDEICEMCSA